MLRTRENTSKAWRRGGAVIWPTTTTGINLQAPVEKEPAECMYSAETIAMTLVAITDLNMTICKITMVVKKLIVRDKHTCV